MKKTLSLDLILRLPLRDPCTMKALSLTLRGSDDSLAVVDGTISSSSRGVVKMLFSLLELL